MPRATSRGPGARVKPIMLVGSAVRSGIQACQTFLPPRNVDHRSAGFIGYMRTSLVTSYNYSLGQQFIPRIIIGFGIPSAKRYSIPRCLYLRPDSSEPGSGGKCNFGPVFGKLYTDGLTDTGAAASCPGNCVVQHQRETYQRSLITTYHHKKAQIRNKRGRRCTIAGIVIARIRYGGS